MKIFKHLIPQEDQQIRQHISEFAQREIAPYVQQWEEDEWFPKELHKKAGDFGALGLGFSTEYGGSGEGMMKMVMGIIVMNSSTILQNGKILMEME